MLLYSGVSDHLIDAKLIPGVQHSMRDRKDNKTVVAAATGTGCGHVIDKVGRSVPFRIFATVVPTLERTRLHRRNQNGGKHHLRNWRPPLAVQRQTLTSAELTPKIYTSVLVQCVSSHPGWCD